MTAADDTVHALPPGTRFGELEVLCVLGAGGFGIVYLARDHALQRDVAIKEYMPSQLALRDGRSQVSVRSASMRDTFELGRRSFVNEARLLARFDHPSLLRVYRFWEANGTAYMVMPRLVGQNLREATHGQPTPPPEVWVRRIFDAVLSGLQALHAQQVWHRDVAPDNIFLPADGSAPILLDFGAARQAIGDKTQSFTAILKPSFAPIEQYAEATNLRQGAWTDFYALAAVMHQLLTGHPPQPATARTLADELAPLALPGYPTAFLAALDWALRVPPNQRPQTAAAWLEAVEGRSSVPPALAASARQRPTFSPPAAPPAAPITEVDISFADTVQGPPPGFDTESPGLPALSGPRAGPRWRWLAAAAALALLLLGLFAAQLRPKPVPQAPAATPEALPLAAASAAAATPAALVASTPAVPSAEVIAAAPAPVALAQASMSVPAGKPLPASQTPSASGSRAPKRADIITERAGEFRPAPPAAVARGAGVTLPAAAPTAPAAIPTSGGAAVAAPAEPIGPREACGGRVLLAKAWCVDRQCERPLFKDHPECVRLRELRSGQSAVP